MMMGNTGGTIILGGLILLMGVTLALALSVIADMRNRRK